MSPLSRRERASLAKILESGSHLDFSYEMIRYSVKDFQAPEFTRADGSAIAATLGDDGYLSEESLELLLSIIKEEKMITVASKALALGYQEWGLPDVEVVGPVETAQEKKA